MLTFWAYSSKETMKTGIPRKLNTVKKSPFTSALAGSRGYQHLHPKSWLDLMLLGFCSSPPLTFIPKCKALFIQKDPGPVANSPFPTLPPLAQKGLVPRNPTGVAHLLDVSESGGFPLFSGSLPGSWNFWSSTEAHRWLVRHPAIKTAMTCKTGPENFLTSYFVGFMTWKTNYVKNKIYEIIWIVGPESIL